MIDLIGHQYLEVEDANSKLQRGKFIKKKKEEKTNKGQD